MQPVVEVLREEIVGLVKTREPGLEVSDMALEIPSPHGDPAVLSTVLGGRSDVFMSHPNFESDELGSSVSGRNVFGLTCGDIEALLPSTSFGSS